MRIGDFSDSLFCAGMACACDLPDMRYAVRASGRAAESAEPDTRQIVRRPHRSDIAIHSFPQSWGSTALGFDELASQPSMVTAQTTVVICGADVAVYFGCRLAYVVPQFGERFAGDMRKGEMAACAEAGCYVEDESKVGGREAT